MKAVRFTLFLLSCISSSTLLAANPQVEFQTNVGNFVVELYPDKAPKTVENFLGYVKSGFYNATLFHRVIERFIIQGGGFSPELIQKETMPPIPNEADNGLKNEFGTVAMARKLEPNTAAAEFFINLEDNKHLNYTRPDPAHMGYCVFGRVISGMSTIEKISHTPIMSVGMLSELPRQNVVIEKSILLETPIALAQQDKTHEVSVQQRIIKPSKKGKKRDQTSYQSWRHLP